MREPPPASARSTHASHGGDERSVQRIARAARAAAPPAVVALAFLAGLSVSWRKWGNLLVDGGRELELPSRLLEGGELYVTVRNLYGPLPAWVNAALYRAFGVHLDVLVGAGIATAALMTLALHALARRFLAPWPSAAVATAFVLVSAFGHLVANPSFNFVIPYAYAATYGITAATLSLLFAVRHVQLGRDRDLALSLALAVVAALCKLEPALAAGAAHAALLAGNARSTIGTPRRLAAYAAAGLALLAVYGALYLRVGPALFADNILSAANASVLFYARDTMGLLDLRDSLRALASSAALVAGALAAGAAVAWTARRWPAAPRRALGAGAAAFVPLAVAAAAMSPNDSLRALPVLAAVVLVALAARLARAPGRRGEILPHLLLWAFGLGCLARLLLGTTPSHYGFYLTPVPLLGMTVALTGGLNEALGRARWPRPAALPGLGVLAGVTAACAALSAVTYAAHDQPFETPRGRLVLADGDPSARAVALLLRLPRGSRVIAVPEGAGAVFMSGQRWADGTFAYVPTDLTGSYDDASLVRRWSADPPDAILLVGIALSEFGVNEFGQEYARRAGAFIERNYEPWSDPKDAVVLLGRRDRRPPFGVSPGSANGPIGE